MNTDFKDRLLFEALSQLMREWQTAKPETGLVAAALYDTSRDFWVAATSVKHTHNGHFMHAEENALKAFEQKYNDTPTPGQTIAAITLSPCLKRISAKGTRSCADLLLDRGINRIHFGKLDQGQAAGEEVYANIGFKESSITYVPAFKEMCEWLSLFFKYGSERLSTDLSAIKNEPQHRVGFRTVSHKVLNSGVNSYSFHP